MVELTLDDAIYEAALVPERWTDVLDRLSARSGSAGGGLFVTQATQAPRWVASACVADALARFSDRGTWRGNQRRDRWAEHPGGFARDVDIFTPEELTRPEYRTHGLGYQIGTVIHMPTGEQVVMSLERYAGDDPHARGAAEALDVAKPHLSRAALLAARLGLERVRSAVETLEIIGLPAAVLTATARVLAANPSLERDIGGIGAWTAQGGLALTCGPSQALFRAAIEAGLSPASGPVRSIPIPGGEGRSAKVLHVVPVRGAAHDIFSGAAAIVVLTELSTARSLPEPEILKGLFDLTPAEARLARGLAAGHTLAEASHELDIRTSTARSHLERIFRKTGTRAQGQLVALLRSGTARLGADEPS